MPGPASLRARLLSPAGRTIRDFVASAVERCVVIEEAIRSSANCVQLAVEEQAGRYFGGLNSDRVRRILEHDDSRPFEVAPGSRPRCATAARTAAEALEKTRLHRIGRHRLFARRAAALHGDGPLVCMGASIGVGLGLRHILPPSRARRVVSDRRLHQHIAGSPASPKWF